MATMDLWFEALPSPAAAAPGRVQQDIDRLQDLAPVVSRIVVPEVLDGAYPTWDPVAYAARVQQQAGIPTTAAVSLPGRSRAQLHECAAEAGDLGVDSLLLVGAANRHEATGSLPVEAALHALAGKAHLGVVTIPGRRRWRVDEPHRLLRKQRAGASFALSQIVFDTAPALALRRAFVAALAPGERPLPVVYALAPVRNRRDIAFLQGLGADLPAGLAAELAGLGRQDRCRRAAQAAIEAAATLAAAHADDALGPCGFCISHVMAGNLEAAIELAHQVRDGRMVLA